MQKYFDGDNNGKKESIKYDQEKLQKLMVRLAEIGDELYDILDPGLTVELNLPTKETILLPNKRPELRQLLITRPYGHLKITVPKGEV